MNRRRVFIGMFLVLATLSIGAPRSTLGATADQPAAAQVEVKIDNFSFLPPVITVAPGTTVRWTNHDDIPHTVVSDDKTTFKSKVLDTDEQFTYTFTKPGSYPYFCSIHPRMTGKVVVQ